jgi:hypothetical protein
MYTSAHQQPWPQFAVARQLHHTLHMFWKLLQHACEVFNQAQTSSNIKPIKQSDTIQLCQGAYKSCHDCLIDLLLSAVWSRTLPPGPEISLNKWELIT